ncbi:unnamed protein product [Cuscuta campestris]|uniref:Uncharacterized protein n=1 Tax=Cuscuta campestris TaxID=132261 RepID=A0A484NK12_9ASTE|nr:unnamed protein product [Cuscuta campestris]
MTRKFQLAQILFLIHPQQLEQSILSELEEDQHGWLIMSFQPRPLVCRHLSGGSCCSSLHHSPKLFGPEKVFHHHAPMIVVTIKAGNRRLNKAFRCHGSIDIAAAVNLCGSDTKCRLGFFGNFYQTGCEQP